MEMDLVIDGHGMLVELYVNGYEEPRCKCSFETSLSQYLYRHLRIYNWIWIGFILVNIAICILYYCSSCRFESIWLERN